MAKVQLDFQVPKGIASKVRKDAKRNSITLDDVGAIILGDFFNSWTLTERANFYRVAERKTRGRKIDA